MDRGKCLGRIMKIGRNLKGINQNYADQRAKGLDMGGGLIKSSIGRFKRFLWIYTDQVESQRIVFG